MSRLVQLPSNYEEVNPNQLLPSEGRHPAVVRQATAEAPTEVHIRYQLVDGVDRGMLVDQMYRLDNGYGLRSFKQLILALGVQPDHGAIDIDLMVGRQLTVMVVHREHDGVTYANVSAHEARV